jgi:hypothetical protein
MLSRSGRPRLRHPSWRRAGPGPILQRPVTFQILDQVGCLGAVALLRTAHHAAIQVFLDGPDNADDHTESDYTPP